MLETIGETVRKPVPAEETGALARDSAATKIQQAWRAKQRARYLQPKFLWDDLTTHARLKLDRDAAERGQNKPLQRWRRAAFLVVRLQSGTETLAYPKGESSDASTKHLETQHWLEMIDRKHRYGSNLKWYHKKWQDADTTDNFFRWLDEGAGKDISLKECARERLEKERILYLSPHQRLNYLVQVDSEGRLHWARNGQLVDTTAGRWKDRGEGKGIVPLDSEHTEIALRQQRLSFSVTPSSSRSSVLSENNAAHGIHYDASQNTSRTPFSWMLRASFTFKGLLDRLILNTKHNTWIYVSDKNLNIYIGIKNPGTFQHSSFLGGGLVTSAGLISVKDGLIHKLTPLSGHYRTSIQHFRHFIYALDERGVDMHEVEISKAEAALWGTEHYNKFRKQQASYLKSVKKTCRRCGTVCHAEQPYSC